MTTSPKIAGSKVISKKRHNEGEGLKMVQKKFRETTKGVNKLSSLGSNNNNIPNKTTTIVLTTTTSTKTSAAVTATTT
jgi:hypothetical protein